MQGHSRIGPGPAEMGRKDRLSGPRWGFASPRAIRFGRGRTGITALGRRPVGGERFFPRVETAQSRDGAIRIHGPALARRPVRLKNYR